MGVRWREGRWVEEGVGDCAVSQLPSLHASRPHMVVPSLLAQGHLERLWSAAHPTTPSPVEAWVTPVFFMGHSCFCFRGVGGVNITHKLCQALGLRCSPESGHIPLHDSKGMCVHGSAWN